jgi:predicted HD phosphohydrolase
LLLKNSGLFSELMVEAVKGTKYEGKLSALDMDQNNPYHMLDLWAHTMQTVANVFSKYGEADAEKRVSILLAALMHDLGKLYKDVQLTVGDKTSYHGHEDESKEMATLILGYLRLEPYIKEVSGLVEHHMRPHRFLPGEGEANMRSMRRFVRKMGEQSLDWLDVFNLAAADALAKDVQIDEELAEKCRQTEELLRDAHASLGEVPVASAVPQVLDGNEIMDALGIRPGAWMGKLIEFVRGLRDENPAITKEEAAKRLRDEFADDPELAQAKKKTAGAGAESWYVTAKKSEKKAPKKTRSRSKWTPVDSTCVKAISYDPESRRLDVKLHDGSRYAYDDVPWQTHRAMMKARSKGEFFNRIVKKKYPLLLD